MILQQCSFEFSFKASFFFSQSIHSIEEKWKNSFLLKRVQGSFMFVDKKKSILSYIFIKIRLGVVNYRSANDSNEYIAYLQVWILGDATQKMLFLCRCTTFQHCICVPFLLCPHFILFICMNNLIDLNYFAVAIIRACEQWIS